MRFILLFIPFFLYAMALPIQFGISEKKIVDHIPEKTQGFAYIVPGRLETYIFSEEEAYYADYQRSFYAFTCKKAGWDCMRHYEILANGCIPYFLDLEDANPNTMFRLPRELILEAMHLRGVTPFGINFQEFDRKRYDEILAELLTYTREKLTTRAIAEYFLDTIGYKGTGKILFLGKNTWPDYQCCTLLTGLKECLGARVVDVPKIGYIYTSFPDITDLYGKGFSYSRIVEDEVVDREDIIRQIYQKEFDFVIYGAIHLGIPYHYAVAEAYGEDEIFYVEGGDGYSCEYKDLPNLFIREFEAVK